MNGRATVFLCCGRKAVGGVWFLGRESLRFLCPSFLRHRSGVRRRGKTDGAFCASGGNRVAEPRAECLLPLVSCKIRSLYFWRKTRYFGFSGKRQYSEAGKREAYACKRLADAPITTPQAVYPVRCCAWKTEAQSGKMVSALTGGCKSTSYPQQSKRRGRGVHQKGKTEHEYPEKHGNMFAIYQQMRNFTTEKEE